VIIINSESELLLFSHEADEWTVVAGAVEPNETIRDAAYRELSEEAGAELSAKAVGVAHAHTFHYDEQVRHMISIYYVMRYERGEIIPGDDMRGAEYRWWTLQDLKSKPELLAIPKHQVWILERAIELAKKYGDEDADLEYFVDGNG